MGNFKKKSLSFFFFFFFVRGNTPDSYPVAIYVFCGVGRLDKGMDLGARDVMGRDSYPVAMYVFCGVRRLDTRMDLVARNVMGRGEGKIATGRFRFNMAFV